MEDRSRLCGASIDDHQRRRGRARHLQRPLLSRARAPPHVRRGADRRLGGRGRAHLPLYARRISGRAAYPGARDRSPRGRRHHSQGPDRASPWRRRLYLRRRVGDDRVDRRQAGLPAQPAALYRRGRPVWPSNSQSECGDALLGTGDPGQGRKMVRRSGDQWRQGPALLVRIGAGEEAGRDLGPCRGDGA